MMICWLKLLQECLIETSLVLLCKYKNKNIILIQDLTAILVVSEIDCCPNEISEENTNVEKINFVRFILFIC